MSCGHAQPAPTEQEISDQGEAILRLCATCGELLFWHGAKWWPIMKNDLLVRRAQRQANCE